MKTFILNLNRVRKLDCTILSLRRYKAELLSLLGPSKSNILYIEDNPNIQDIDIHCLYFYPYSINDKPRSFYYSLFVSFLEKNGIRLSNPANSNLIGFHNIINKRKAVVPGKNRILSLFTGDDLERLQVILDAVETANYDVLLDYTTNSFPQYFHPKVCPSADDIVFDCGTFDGKTTLDFSLTCRHVHGFEPNPINYNISKSTVKSCNNVTLYNVGVTDKNSVSKITNDSYASKLDASGEFSTKTISLDSLAIPGTLIKMDIEGSELDALQGAINTIRKYSPKLQIAIYHYPNHYVDIPLFIKDLQPDYKFYLGFHSPYALLDRIILYAHKE